MGSVRSLSIFASLLLVGCSSSSGGSDTTTPTFRGSVSYVDATPAAGGVVGSMLVEGPVDAAYAIDRIGLTIMVDTRFTIDGEKLDGAAGIARIAPGDLVEGYVTGPVAESYPVQGSASSIQLVEAMTWNSACVADADCRLVDTTYGWGCCSIGACRTIDYAEERWIAVNGAWFDRMRGERCPTAEQCGPAPACPDQIVGAPHEAVCVAGACVKRLAQ
ncbi:MAG: hypothetical protein HQK87_06740 [Nitrospinae bacterium]|nr:hypothetical protein [Nitrospinota bacterium]